MQNTTFISTSPGDKVVGVASKSMSAYEEIMNMISCMARPVKLTFSRIILVSTKKLTSPTTATASTSVTSGAGAGAGGGGGASQIAREDSKRIFKTLSSHTTQHTLASGTGSGVGTLPTGSHTKDSSLSVSTSHTPSPIYSASMSEYASQSSSKNASPRGTRKKAGAGAGGGLRIDVNTITLESTDAGDGHTPHRYTYTIML